MFIFRWWSNENPRWVLDIKQVRSDQIMAWAGIINHTIIGPFYFDGNVTAEAYIELLGDFVIPQLHQLGFDLDDIWFQHDGAPAHRAIVTQHFLDEHFGNWIGLGGDIKWPARSPDLTPLDFFFWGYLRDRIYRTRPANIQELQSRIENCVETITVDMLDRVRDNIEQRVLLCQAAEGQHFEQFL